MTQQPLQKKALSKSTATPSSSEFLQMRPFAQSRNTETQGELAPPDLQAQVERASRFGQSFGKLAIQPKLTIGEPGDKYEQEADLVAAQVVQRINQREAVSAKQEEKKQRVEKHEESEIQMKSLVQRRVHMVCGKTQTDFESGINSAKGGGEALNTGLQRSMGQAMGADFSGVRVHTDAQSDQLNQSIQAKAFTTGQDVFFRQGAYEPGSRGGQELIAHELTHVVQQSGGGRERKEEMSVEESRQKSIEGRKKVEESKINDTVQREISEEDRIKDGTKIKIWDGLLGDVVVVIFRGFVGENVKYDIQGEGHEGRADNKKNGKNKGSNKNELFVAREWAFLITTKNNEIAAYAKGNARVKLMIEASGGIHELVVDFWYERLKEGYENRVEDMPNRNEMMEGILLDQGWIGLTIKNGGEILDFTEIEEEEGRDYMVDEIMLAVQGYGYKEELSMKNGSIETGVKDQDWKSKKTRNKKKKAVDGLIGKDEVTEELRRASSLHHKIPRETLKKFIGIYKGAAACDGVSAVGKWLDGERKGTGGGDSDVMVIENWAANLELGVSVEARKAVQDDPGNGFDGNYYEGLGTPRTVRLERLMELMCNGELKEDDWKEVGVLLNDVSERHRQQARSEGGDECDLTKPLTTQWRRKGAGFNREKKN